MIFGRGEFARLADIVVKSGQRPFIVTGNESLSESGTRERLDDAFAVRKLVTEFASIGSEPTIAAMEELIRQARDFRPNCIIGIGGGSAIDAAKLIGSVTSKQTPHGGTLEAFLNGEGGAESPLPKIAVPTTASSGAEVTRAVVYSDGEGHPKKIWKGRKSAPDIALVDPTLTVSLPPGLTSAGAMGTLSRLMESFVSRRAGILTDGLAKEGFALLSEAMEPLARNPENYQARESMAMAALLSGMASDNAGLGAVHALALTIGGMWDVPYSLICADLLPEVTRANLDVALREDREGKVISKYREISRLLTGDPRGELDELVLHLKDWQQRFNLPSLHDYGVQSENIPSIVQACRLDSMDTNCVYLDNNALVDVLDMVID